MPRPKRTKVAPSALAPRVRNTAKQEPPVEIPAPSNPEFNDLYDVSDEEERRLARARLLKTTTGNQDSTITGAKVARNGNREEAQGDAEIGTAENVMEEIGLGSSSPAIETGRKEMATPRIESSHLAISKFKKRARQPSILGRGPSRMRSSSIDSNLVEDNGLTSVGRKNVSTFGGGRQREQSVGRAPAPMLPSSMALQMGTPAHGSAMKIANFKRRAREPSILGTAQKKQSRQMFSDEGEAEEDEDDFNPDDESTPLNLAKNKSATSSSVPSSSNPRKRKLSTVQVPQSSPSLPSPRAASIEEMVPSTELAEDEPEDESESDVSSDSNELPILSIERNRTPDLLSDTMAPPLSSSPSLPSHQPPPTSRTAATRGRRPLRNNTTPPRAEDSPISSPPSLTHSPNIVPQKTIKPRTRKAVPAPNTLSTAQLQALLPRRRRRQARDEFSIPSSEEEEFDVANLASEDDELEHIRVRPRTARNTRTPAPPAPKRGPKSKPKPSSKTTSKLATSIPKDTTNTTSKNKRRTYSSRSDKENDHEFDEGLDEGLDTAQQARRERENAMNDSLGPLPDDYGMVENIHGVDDGEERSETSQELEERVGRELKRAARKFREVDKWELEFEEVTASSSSPRDAR